MKIIQLGLTALIFFIGCQREAFENSPFENIPISSHSDITISTLELERLELEEILSSLNGELLVKDDTLIFFDISFSKAFLFGQDGKLLKEELGVGPGPREIPYKAISFIGERSDGGLVLIGSSNDYHLIDPAYNRTKSSFIKWQNNPSPEYLQNNPTPTAHRAYDLAYNLGEIEVMGDYAYLPLASPPPPFSKFNLTTDLYAHEARISAKMNLETGKPEELLGRFSPVYQQNKDARIFSFYSMSADLDKQHFYITYRPDSLIYVMDKKLQPLHAFGVEGRNMDTDYKIFPSTDNIEKLNTHWQKEVKTRGYYTGIHVEPKLNLIFRSYTKGKNNLQDGLQIYRGKTLMADVDVPSGFKVTGYAEPYIYSSVFVNEENDLLYVYRFPVNNLF